MRYASLIIILFIVIACRYSPSFPSPETAPGDEAQPATSSIPAVPFTRATAAPTQAPAGQNKNGEVTTPDRGYEDGLPLAARVNNQPLFLNTLERQVKQYKQALLNRGVDLTSAKGQTLLSQTQKQVFESLLDQLIIEQKAIDLGIFISDEEVEAKIQETISQMPADMRFEDWLVENDLTYQEFFAISQAQLIASQVFERITRNVPEVADQVQLKYIRVANSDAARVVIEKILTG
ncbi:MAG: SurA N-terminal domain-containing protein, partial [Anaerolineae bacterium]|nr:SurA N-terminal domain-containing protein [Anaerolineae bacterium]